MKTEEDTIRALLGKAFKPECIMNEQIDNVVMADYPDFCDAFLSYAEWKVDGTWLTDDELDQFQEGNPEFIHELAYESAF